MATIRKAEWGNWGLTFYSEIDGKIILHGNTYFPVGACGPMDGFIGSPERQKWLDQVKAWMSKGLLPEGLDTRLASKEGQ